MTKKSKNCIEHTQPVVPHNPLELDISYMSSEDVLSRLNTTASGLTAGQASERLRRHGPNSISVKVPIPIFKLFRENFLHTMALLLWCAGAIGFVAQMPQLAIAIWLVNIINGTFSFCQEYRAEKATEALKRLLPPTVQALRDGNSCTIQASELVPGDIILVSEGDKISADARLIFSESLEVDQSTLSGESRAVRKSAQSLDPPSRNGTFSREQIPNLLFAGTTVVTGHGTAVVYATGTSTEFGRIARLTQTIVDQLSPLQKEMVRVTRMVSGLAVGIGVIMFAVATIVTHTNPDQAFVFAMGMIVAFVPEGMVPTVTLSLALAVQRMARRNALVKKLSSVEALGCTNVICTDKTGTLTENQMTVTQVLAGGIKYGFTGLGYALNGSLMNLSSQIACEANEDLRLLLRAGILCNNATLTQSGDCLVTTGDPTELALLVAAGKLRQFKHEEEQRAARIHENTFDSHRKLMSTVHQLDDKKVSYVKGSPLVVLERCTRYTKDGIEEKLDTSMIRFLHEQINAYAEQGLRVIASAMKELGDYHDCVIEDAEHDLTFLGLFAMYDPPRPEVEDAVQKCHKAGIDIVMITGDYEVTAEAIARKVGIITQPDPRLITGTQLDRMSDQELIESLTGQTIFARVNPEHKLRIVQCFQKRGKIVAVTGDGVNDAPALKKADIGVAMGLSGTDVAREASDMILLDDNFASIVNAVQEGRAVYDNIKKFAVYVFNSNMAEAVPFVVMLLSCGLVPMPLTVMQVLAVDLGTDMVPAIGLGADPAAEGVMQRHPRSLSQPLLSAGLLAKALVWYGGIESIAAISGYFFLNWLHGWPQVALAAVGTDVWRAATTMTFACIVAGQVGAVFCCRTERESIFSINPFGNKLIVVGVLVELILLATLIYTPCLQPVFNTFPLGVTELAFAFAWVPIMIVLDEIRKLFIRNAEVRNATVIGGGCINQHQG